MRRRGAELPPALSSALLLAAVRLSNARAEALRPDTLLVDESGQLELASLHGPDSDAYRAPELQKGSAPPRDPRVLVYAAGALGYELVTLRRLEGGPGAELTGPLEMVIRKAVSVDRRSRYRNLEEMSAALEEIQARPSEDEERLILAAVASTGAPTPQKLARLQLRRATPPAGELPFAELAEVEAEPVDAAPEAGLPFAFAEPEEGAAEAGAHEPHPLLAEQWDPLSAPPAVPAPLVQEASVIELLQTQAIEAHRPSVPPPVAEGVSILAVLEAETRERRDDMAVLETRIESLSRLGVRLSAIEERLRSLPPAAQPEPPVAQPVSSAPPVVQPVPPAPPVTSVLSSAQPVSLAPPPAHWRTAAVAGGSALVGAAAMFALLSAFGPHAAPAPVSPAAVAAVAAPPPSKSAVDPAPKPLAVPPVVVASLAAPTKAPEPVSPPEPAAKPEKRPRRAGVAAATRAAATDSVTRGEAALRAFDTAAATAAFTSALELDPQLPAAHRGMGMVYVLQGKNAEAKAEYQRYLKLAPDAADRAQIQRLLSK